MLEILKLGSPDSKKVGAVLERIMRIAKEEGRDTFVVAMEALDLYEKASRGANDGRR
jgi:hypothetical protein